MNHNYILAEDGKTPILCDDLLEWAKWFEEATKNKTRMVGQEVVNGFMVSTVFLGIDHNFFGEDRSPLLWETMIFDAPSGSFLDLYCERYDNYDSAKAKHDKIVEVLSKMDLLQEQAIMRELGMIEEDDE